MDLLLVLEAQEAGLQLAVCDGTLLAREASERHQLASGSAAALGQALTGALLIAATEGGTEPRVDVQLECGGPLRGLLVDADSSGAVRGLVRVNQLDRHGARVEGEPRFAAAGPLERFDARPVLATGQDEQAGLISVLRAQPGSETLHRAAFPFAGADLGAALTLYLRSDRERGGELALDVAHRAGEPLFAVAGALLWATAGEPVPGRELRQGGLFQAMLRSEGKNAHALAQELSRELSLGPLRLLTEVRPRFACRCNRERVVRALGTLGAAELRDMAGRDGGASATCDFCMTTYRIPAAELLELALGGAQPS